MNRMFKHLLLAISLLSVGTSMRIAAQDGQDMCYDSPLSIRNDLIVIGNSIKKMSQQAFDYARTNTPEWISQTGTYLAQKPTPAEGASCYGYATADNAKNVLAKAGAVAVVAAASYAVYKCYKYAKRTISVACCCAQCHTRYDWTKIEGGCPQCGSRSILKSMGDLKTALTETEAVLTETNIELAKLKTAVHELADYDDDLYYDPSITGS